ncbi:hypothetical protein AB28_5266 [Raoultella ornithinolytica 2-156-04_S1_C2]|nr:hypothetical protein AB00_5275 [Raoultella ornithinolytica 2-156-04_S1_C1]KDX09170.1 hypothetical protein AB28_5266 [Raoultella ornithinolytica 2-156-04_S1_C2]
MFYKELIKNTSMQYHPLTLQKLKLYKTYNFVKLIVSFLF